MRRSIDRNASRWDFVYFSNLFIFESFFACSISRVLLFIIIIHNALKFVSWELRVYAHKFLCFKSTNEKWKKMFVPSKPMVKLTLIKFRCGFSDIFILIVREMFLFVFFLCFTSPFFSIHKSRGRLIQSNMLTIWIQCDMNWMWMSQQLFLFCKKYFIFLTDKCGAGKKNVSPNNKIFFQKYCNLICFSLRLIHLIIRLKYCPNKDERFIV